MQRRRRIEEERQAAMAAMVKSIAGVHATAPFRDRGFSNRTIDALIARGIDAPERLLFATEAELKNSLGVGQASFTEIMHYRARFIPEQ